MCLFPRKRDGTENSQRGVLSKTSFLNNLCVFRPRRQRFAHCALLARACVFHRRAYADTHARIHTTRPNPHEFSIIQIGFPYWVSAGGPRRFSLSIGRGFPAKLFPSSLLSKVTNLPLCPLRPVAVHGKCPQRQPPFLEFVRFSGIFRPKMRMLTPPLKILLKATKK